MIPYGLLRAMHSRNSAGSVSYKTTYVRAHRGLWLLTLVSLHERNIEHRYIMAQASGHDKHVEDLMRSKELVSGIEDRKFQCVNNSADGVDDTACNQPYKGCFGEGLYQRYHGQDTEPAHGNINHGGEPFRAGDPECFDQHADDGSAPYQSQKRIADGIPKRNDTDRSVASGNEDKNHHMVYFPKDSIDLFGNIKGMVGSAGTIEQDHTACKNGKSKDRILSIAGSCKCQKRHGCQDG